jgi:hypothetical protein
LVISDGGGSLGELTYNVVRISASGGAVFGELSAGSLYLNSMLVVNGTTFVGTGGVNCPSANVTSSKLTFATGGGLWMGLNRLVNSSGEWTAGINNPTATINCFTLTVQSNVVAQGLGGISDVLTIRDSLGNFCTVNGFASRFRFTGGIYTGQV